MNRIAVRFASLLLIAAPATPAFAQADAFAVGTVVTDAKGGPVCASVRPPAINWSTG